MDQLVFSGHQVSYRNDAAPVLVLPRKAHNNIIKSLDEETVLAAAKETGGIVTAEEHQLAGGMGSAVAEYLVRNCPVPMEMVGIQDSFGESGQPAELMKKYGLNADSIAEKIRRVLARKNQFH